MKKKGDNLYRVYWEKKTDPENYDNVIGLRWSDVQGEDEEYIAQANLIEK